MCFKATVSCIQVLFYGIWRGFFHMLLKDLAAETYSYSIINKWDEREDVYLL